MSKKRNTELYIDSGRKNKESKNRVGREKKCCTVRNVSYGLQRTGVNFVSCDQRRRSHVRCVYSHVPNSLAFIGSSLFYTRASYSHFIVHTHTRTRSLDWNHTNLRRSVLCVSSDNGGFWRFCCYSFTAQLAFLSHFRISFRSKSRSVYLLFSLFFDFPGKQTKFTIAFCAIQPED